jgi:hypothetical protein
MRVWDVFVSGHFIGVIQAATEAEALEASYWRFGQHVRDIVSVRVRSDDNVPSPA